MTSTAGRFDHSSRGPDGRPSDGVPTVAGGAWRGPGGTIVPAAPPQDSTPMRTFG
jgi:hypothetical protein